MEIHVFKVQTSRKVKIKTMYFKTKGVDQLPLALKRLRFVFDTFDFLKPVHVRSHDLSVRFHHFRDVRLFHNG